MFSGFGKVLPGLIGSGTRQWSMLFGAKSLNTLKRTVRIRPRGTRAPLVCRPARSPRSLFPPRVRRRKVRRRQIAAFNERISRRWLEQTHEGTKNGQTHACLPRMLAWQTCKNSLKGRLLAATLVIRCDKKESRHGQLWQVW